MVLLVVAQLSCGSSKQPSAIERISVDYDRELGVIYFEGRVFLDTEASGSPEDLEVAYANPRFLKEASVFLEGEEVILSETTEEGGSSEGSGEKERRYKPGEYEFYY